MNEQSHGFEPEDEDEAPVQLVWPPRAGGPTDEQMKREAEATAAGKDADLQLSVSTEAYFECYSIDPEGAHQMFWEHVHLLTAMGISIDDDQAKIWTAFGYHAPITDTGALSKTERGLVLRRDDGGEWLLPGVTAVGGRRATVTGIRTGFDVLSDATIS